jgi:hypothetical protein
MALSIASFRYFELRLRCADRALEGAHQLSSLCHCEFVVVSNSVQDAFRAVRETLPGCRIGNDLDRWINGISIVSVDCRVFFLVLDVLSVQIIVFVTASDEVTLEID